MELCLSGQEMCLSMFRPAKTCKGPLLRKTLVVIAAYSFIAVSSWGVVLPSDGRPAARLAPGALAHHAAISSIAQASRHSAVRSLTDAASHNVVVPAGNSVLLPRM